MAQTTTNNTTSSSYTQLKPSVPTDSCAILNSLLVLSEHAKREVAGKSQPPLVPRGVITMMLRGMKVRDPSIILHGQRIAAISRGVSRLMGWEETQQAELELAALLHDMGKIGVPDHIIHKPGKLSSEEYDFVTLYHHAATAMMQSLQVNLNMVTMLTMLHRNFDAAGIETKTANGAGEVPLGSRILAVADAYDSLSTPKPYRRGMTHEEVIAILNEESGSRYDGNVVQTLNRWYETEGDQLFPINDQFGEQNSIQAASEQDRTEVVVMTQILNVLYQFQALYDGYFILDADMNYCIWSDGMQELTGKKLEQVAGKRWQPSDVRLVPIGKTGKNEAGTTEEIVPQVIRNGRAQFGSRVCEVEGAMEVSVDVHTIPITSSPGNVTGVIQLFRNKGGVRRQSREYVELKLAATRDALTGVANRGQLETQLRHLLDDFRNHEGARTLSMIFLDVDKFKNINDTYGHKTGDQVLVDLTRLLQHETYSGEIIARYGGEEFVVLCPDTDLKTAIRRSERLRTAIAKSSVGGVGGLNVTSSFGISTARLGDSVQTILERADACLYRAKETGRNRTCWEGQDGEDTAEEEVDTTVEEGVTEVNGSLQFCQEIKVSTSLELTAMKLNAFIEVADDINVLEMEQGHVKLRMGSLGFTKRWGASSDRQAIEMDVTFETCREPNQSGEGKTRRRINVKITPLGKTPDQAMFETRCLQVMMQLRSYLLVT